MIIGITGGTGCGKTTLLSRIAECGGKVIDCDAVYHQLLKTDTALLCAIENRFPGTVVHGQLERKRLGQIVFSDKNALEELNNLTHPAVKAEVLKQLTPTPTLAALDAIGLLESGLNALCDVTVAVTAPKEQQIQRLMRRDGIDRDYALARVSAQPSSEEFSARCDYTLENDTTEEAFNGKCLAFLADLGIISV